MPDEVETTATEPAPASNPVPATTAPPVDVEKIAKAAADKARREAQSNADKQMAKLHQQYQAQIRELKQAVAPRLQKAGFEPDPIFQDVDVLQKARQFDELSAQARQAAEWQQHVEGVAAAYGLNAADERLAGATSAQDLLVRAQAAMQADAAKAREQALTEARAAAAAAATARVENGDLDTLGGAPAAATLTHKQKVEQAQKELKALVNSTGPKDLKKLAELKAMIRAG